MKKLFVLLIIISALSCKKEEIVPISIRITRITLTDFPATDANGAGWDVLDGPDIYIEIRLDNQTIYKHNQFYEDATPNNEYDFIPTTNINLDRPTNNYQIGLLDYDDNISADDPMGVITFQPYQGNTPNIVNLTAPGTEVAFQLELVYTF